MTLVPSFWSRRSRHGSTRRVLAGSGTAVAEGQGMVLLGNAGLGGRGVELQGWSRKRLAVTVGRGSARYGKVRSGGLG